MLRRDQVQKEKQTKTEINAKGRGREVTKPGRQRPQESPAARAPAKRGHSVSATHRPAQPTWSRDRGSQRRCTALGPCPPRGHRRAQWAGAGVTHLGTARPTAALESTRGEDWAGLSLLAAAGMQAQAHRCAPRGRGVSPAREPRPEHSPSAAFRRGGTGRAATCRGGRKGCYSEVGEDSGR